MIMRSTKPIDKIFEDLAASGLTMIRVNNITHVNGLSHEFYRIYYGNDYLKENINRERSVSLSTLYQVFGSVGDNVRTYASFMILTSHHLPEGFDDVFDLWKQLDPDDNLADEPMFNPVSYTGQFKWKNTTP